MVMVARKKMMRDGAVIYIEVVLSKIKPTTCLRNTIEAVGLRWLLANVASASLTSDHPPSDHCR